LLRKLSIKNYALVESLDIEFSSGLTVITGETGAGKSVIISGLLLSLGERADRDFIRHGQSKATANAVFDLPPGFSLKNCLPDTIKLDKDSGLSLRRDLTATSTRGYINDTPCNLQDIRSLAASLTDFHSQQGQRQLLEIEKHRFFLDSFAGLSTDVEQLENIFDEFRNAELKLKQARDNASAMKERLELIAFQIDELEKAALRSGEESELDGERRRLESVRTLFETGQNIIQSVSNADESIIGQLSQLEKMLRDAARLDPELKNESGLLSETVVNLNELTRNLESYLSRLEDNPERLEEINARLSELFRLRRKYNTDETGLIAKLEELREESADAADYKSLLKKLEEKRNIARENYSQLALKISKIRHKAAPQLVKKIIKELSDLAMTKARFEVDFQTEYDETGFEINGEKVKAWPHGLENTEFLISTNPNEPLRPVAKIASGGEISRIMLAILTVIAGHYNLPTLIFDEIDTGIGGRTATKLAERLKQLARKHQIITISHLRAVAQAADHHLAVEKNLEDGRNIIKIREVTGRQAKAELARMEGR